MQDKRNKSIKSLWFPLVWEALFVASYLFVWLRDDKRHQNMTLYFMFLFYVGLIVYYHKSFSIREFFRNFLKVKTFILPVLGAGVCIFLAHLATQKIIPAALVTELRLPLSFPNGMIDEAMLALTLLLLQPLAEELFFRSGLICFESKMILAVSILISLILNAVSWSITPWRMLEALLVALPMVVFYCLTKNIYVTILVHVVYNIAINASDMAYYIGRLWFA